MVSLFPGFSQRRLSTSGTEINLRYGGSGPPLLLIHGYPQTHAMWHRVAPELARRFTVVIPDLRGYGDSGKPASAPDHGSYAKRAMAQDMIEIMQALGHSRFAVAGHDRGGRVAYRLALDHPEAVSKLVSLDVVPTYVMWRRMGMAEALRTYHWMFLAQPDGLPEKLIGGDPEYFLRETLRRWAGTPDAFAPEAMAEYVRCFRDPATIHATCEDYRAGATIDLQHDEADHGRRKIRCPMLVLWSARGFASDDIGSNPVAIWQAWADDVRGHALACGHFLAEEAPDEVLAALTRFL
ncbi:MAG TPA: alpha/beta hydrolase [Alphaproteobacteria bacterium]